MEELETGVQKNVKPQQQLMVILNADEGVNHGRIVEVMDRVRRVKGARLAIATRRE